METNKPAQPDSDLAEEFLLKKGGPVRILIHSLNNVIMIISGYSKELSEELKKEPPNKRNLKEYSNTLVSSSKKMLKIVSDFEKEFEALKKRLGIL